MSKFAAVLVETSALKALEYDFLGAHSVALPAFYKLMADEQVALLDRNVLHQKIKSNIRNSRLIADLQALNGVYDSLDTLDNLGEGVRQAVDTLKAIDLQTILEQRFEELYANAEKLPDFNVEDAMSCYFADLPPFDGVQDHVDLADALVIFALIERAMQNPKEQILVVSDNFVWHQILDEIDNISVEDSVESALKRWQFSKEFDRRLLKHCKKEIEDRIKWIIDECEFEAVDAKVTIAEVEIHDYELTVHDMILLQVEERRLVGRVFAALHETSGIARHKYCKYDDDNETWFSYGYAEMSFEVEITFDRQDLSSTLKVAKVKLVDRGAISISISDDD